MRSRSILTILVMLAFAGACAPASEPQPVDTQADADAVRALADRELAAAAAGDPSMFSAMLTADAVMMPPNEPARAGAAVLPWVQDFMAAVTVSNASYQHDEVTILGDVAIHRFSFTWTITPRAGGTPFTETGKGIHIMRRQADGTWRIAHDVWNTDAPAPSM